MQAVCRNRPAYSLSILILHLSYTYLILLFHTFISEHNVKFQMNKKYDEVVDNKLELV